MNAGALAACCVGSILAGCAAPQRGIAPDGALPAATLASASIHAAVSDHRRAKLTLRIRVPSRRAHFISSSTKGITIALSGTASRNFAFGLTPALNPNCTVVGGVTTCTIPLSLEAGSYTMNVATFDQPPYYGAIPTNANVLATADKVPMNVQTGVANAVHMTLDGVPASFTVTGLPGGSGGTAFASPQSFAVTARDSSGEVIVGTYGNAVTLTDSDTSGATSIVTGGSDHPSAGELLSSSDTVTLSYSGLSIAPATIGAHATGATSHTAAFAPVPAPIVLTSSSDAMNPSILGVDLYATSGTGSTAAFTASEVGWTNSPYNQVIAATPDSGCSSIATVAPPSGTSFTAAVAGTPTGASSCTLTLSGGGRSLQIPLYYSRYTYTGAEQTLEVPANVAQMTIIAAGAAGGAGALGFPAGALGGSVTATVPVTPPETLAVYVGGAGNEAVGNPNLNLSVAAGYNGGGEPGFSDIFAGSGGGASDVRRGGNTLANRIVVGGGGGGSASVSARGGAGGNPGGNGVNSPGLVSTGGHGGDDTLGGGADGTNSGCTALSIPGSLGQGGTSPGYCDYGGGGGGGGYYGGGVGGGWTSGSAPPGASGGGGGSSFAEASATNTSFTTGTQNGAGVIVLIF